MPGRTVTLRATVMIVYTCSQIDMTNFLSKIVCFLVTLLRILFDFDDCKLPVAYDTCMFYGLNIVHSE